MSPIEVPAKIQLVEKRETRTSRGMLSKGWYHVDDQLVMVKGNSITEAGTAGYEPYSEVMASLIAQVLGLPHVEYALMPAKLFPDIQTYSCDVVSVCPKFTTDEELTDTKLRYQFDRAKPFRSRHAQQIKLIDEPVLPVRDLDTLYTETMQAISPILALLSEKRASAIRQYLKYRLHYLKAAMG